MKSIQQQNGKHEHEFLLPKNNLIIKYINNNWKLQNAYSDQLYVILKGKLTSCKYLISQRPTTGKLLYICDWMFANKYQSLTWHLSDFNTISVLDRVNDITPIAWFTQLVRTQLHLNQYFLYLLCNKTFN